MDNLTYFDFIPLELLEIITLYVNDYDGLLWINTYYPKILLNNYLWLNKVKESFERLYNTLSTLNIRDINRIIVEKILDNSVSIKRKIELYSGIYKVYDSIEKRLKNKQYDGYYKIKIISNMNYLIPLLPEYAQKVVIEDIERHNNGNMKNEYRDLELQLDFRTELSNDEEILVELYLISRLISIRGFSINNKVDLLLDTDKAIDLYLGAMPLI